MASSATATSHADWMLGDVPGVELTATGRLVDIIDPTITRADLPEERVRQYYARVLIDEYNYPRDCIALGVPIAIGSETKQADIAIYDSPESRHERLQGRIVLIVETKEPTLKTGRAQLVSYIFASSAQGGVWFNGKEIAYYRRIDRPSPSLTDWTNIPRHGETWDTVGHYKKSQLKPPRDLKQVFQRCHNAIYRSGLDSEDVAFDMVRLILAKYRDEQNEGEVCAFRCTPEEFATADGRRKVGDRVHRLFKQVVLDHPDVFPAGEEITIGNDNLATVVNELQPYRFLADDETEEVYDVIGTAFEVYVSTHLKGARGQYFTNRLVVNLMVEMMNPSERDVVYDPACGSGGFLIACLRHVRNKILASGRKRGAIAREIRAASARLFGSDIAPKLVRVAKTNMILNGDGHGGVVQANALRDPVLELPESYPLHPSGRQRPTMIFTNPPFGASHDLREKNGDVLGLFRLGHAWVDDSGAGLRQTDQLVSAEGVPPEILFLERCVLMLPPGGKLAIVIARGVLDNREALAARTFLLRETRLLAVMNCHPNTFAPFNGTKASILVVERKKNPGIESGENYPVFMAISQRVGQDSQGREIFKTDANGDFILRDGQRVLDHDLEEIGAAWQEFMSGGAIRYHAAWTVPVGRILASADMRLNPLRFAPKAEQALARVLELADSDTWRVERLGDIANVFNGPRFKRPFADDGVTDGPGVYRMFTPKAFFEERGESVKYLDAAKASKTQLRQLQVLTLLKNWILIVDSGTAGKLLGKVGMTTTVHENTIGNNNLIRVVIEDELIRDYVYQFLRTDIGQSLLLRNVYGTNQDHVEPDDVKDLQIPIPRDPGQLALIHAQVRELNEVRERAALLDASIQESIGGILDQTEIGEADA